MLDLQLNVKPGVCLHHRAGFSCLRSPEEKGTRGSGGESEGIGSLTPVTSTLLHLATHKDFPCHSSARYYEWAQVLRNPITTTVPDPCHRPYVCYSHVPGIRKDVPISSLSFLQTHSLQSLTSISLAVSGKRAAALVAGRLAADNPLCGGAPV